MENDSRSITACLALDPKNKGWIIEKFALRLQENLPRWGVQAKIAPRPSRDADINHYMIYHHCRDDRTTRGTVLITHVDDYEKLLMVKRSLQVVDVGICLSRMTVEDLVRQGIPRRQLCHITPAHDGLMVPRRISVGITTNLYEDGRKRERLLLELAGRVSLELFHFEIIGRDWEKVIPHLEAAGATVRYYPGSDDFLSDYQVNLERLPTCEYYLYMGLDEGSLGTLDALAAGVATIVTPQGFHLDLEGGLTHSFWDAGQLCDVFGRIARERRRRIDSVKHLTWSEYARQHAVVWKALLDGKQDDLDHLLHAERGKEGKGSRITGRAAWEVLRSRAEYYARPFLRRLPGPLRRK
jgi:hypothetical protein